MFWCSGRSGVPALSALALGSFSTGRRITLASASDDRAKSIINKRHVVASQSLSLRPRCSCRHVRRHLGSVIASAHSLTNEFRSGRCYMPFLKRRKSSSFSHKDRERRLAICSFYLKDNRSRFLADLNMPCDSNGKRKALEKLARLSFANEPPDVQARLFGQGYRTHDAAEAETTAYITQLMLCQEEQVPRSGVQGSSSY